MEYIIYGKGTKIRLNLQNITIWGLNQEKSEKEWYSVNEIKYQIKYKFGVEELPDMFGKIPNNVYNVRYERYDREWEIK